MQSAGVKGFADYLDYLEVDPDEFTQLFNTILINVTGFFRDAAPWEYLRDEVLPRPDRGAGSGRRRSASGARAAPPARRPTPLAMLLAEALGVEAFRERVKIYATDVDEEALAQARQAVYAARDVEDVPAPAAGAVLRPAGRPVSSSARTCAARSSSAGTTSCRTPRSRASTC